MHALLLPGDGIGPEVMAEVERVIAFFNARAKRLTTETALVGGAGQHLECRLGAEALQIRIEPQHRLLPSPGAAGWPCCFAAVI